MPFLGQGALSIGSFAIRIAPSFDIRPVALLVLLPPLPGPCRCLRLLLGSWRIGSPPFTHPCGRLNLIVGPSRSIAYCHAESLYFCINFVFAAIPLQPVALVKPERSPPLAAFVDAKLPDLRHQLTPTGAYRRWRVLRQDNLFATGTTGDYGDYGGIAVSVVGEYTDNMVWVYKDCVVINVRD